MTMVTINDDSADYPAGKIELNREVHMYTPYRAGLAQSSPNVTIVTAPPVGRMVAGGGLS